MNRAFPTTLQALLCLAALAPDRAAVAQGTMADFFARAQDFSTSPPTYGFQLEQMLQWARPNRTYEHMTGPPFPGPRPFYLPQGLYSIYLSCKSGSWVSSTTPRCVRTSRSCFLTMVFTDGSRYSMEDISVTETCSDGSSTSFQKRYQVAELGPPGNRDWLVSVDSWTQESLETRKRHVRGRAGATASFTNRGGVPVVTGGPLEIDMAPGGVLDLTQNPSANGHLFITDTPAVIRCDTVLLDPGVTLADLFQPPPLLQASDLIVEENAVLPIYIATRQPGSLSADAFLLNPGNTDNLMQIVWNGAYSIPGQVTATVPAGGLQRVALPLQLPPGTPVGSRGQVQVQVRSLTDPTLQRVVTVEVAHDHPGMFRFGPGTPGCLGTHSVDADGPVTAGGPSVRLSCDLHAPSAAGLFVFGVPVGGRYGTLTLPGLGTELYVDPQGPLFVSVLVLADPAGNLRFPIQIPPNPGLRALRLVFQPLMLWPASCASGALTVSSGPALGFEVQ